MKVRVKTLEEDREELEVVTQEETILEVQEVAKLVIMTLTIRRT